MIGYKTLRKIRRLLRNPRRAGDELRRRGHRQAANAAQNGRGGSPDLHPESFLIITLDSCRYDIFDDADIPVIKSIGEYFQAHSPAVFTFAAHAALFVGMTPGIASSRERYKNPKVGRIFRIVNRVAGGIRSDYMQLQGRTIVDGFRNRGYYAIGTASSRWFNPDVPTGTILTQDFNEFFNIGIDLEAQVGWLLNRMEEHDDQPIFAFINVGETHVPYHYRGAPWKKKNPCVLFGEENDAQVCHDHQLACLEFCDRVLAPLIQRFQNVGASILCMGDHGDCHGEDGLWAHGIYHENVMRVPMLYHLRPHHISADEINLDNENVEVLVLEEMGFSPAERIRHRP